MIQIKNIKEKNMIRFTERIHSSLHHRLQPIKHYCIWNIYYINIWEKNKQWKIIMFYGLEPLYNNINDTNRNILSYIVNSNEPILSTGGS